MQNMASIISALAAGGIFVVLLFVLKWSLIIDLPIAAGTYFGLYMITKPARKIGNVNIELLDDGEELEKKLEQAIEDYENIRKSVGKIIDLQVKETAQKLCETSAKIIEYLENNPEKIRQARQFIDYYQDTAAKLLKRYITLQNSEIDNAEVSRLKKETKSAFITLDTAFNNQFEKLMRGELIDMQADIDVLEKMVKSEMN